MRVLLVAIGAALLFRNVAPAQAPKDDAQERNGGFVTVPSPITSAAFYGVRKECEALVAARARVIVFHIQPGKSDYEDCLKLASYISDSLHGAKTVAFVSEPLTGHAVMVALAADELVMSSKAEIGDIGRDERFISPVMHTGYAELARKRMPAYEALILGMLEKEHEVWEVRTAQGKKFVFSSGLEKLQQEQNVIEKQVVIPKGQLGYFSSERARSLGLAKRLLETRGEVADDYGLPRGAAIESLRVDERRPVRIRIEGMVDPIMQEYVRRHVKESLERGKNFFIFEIDSGGGFAKVGIELAEFIKDLRGVKTVAYIPREALSAAAFVALGCDEIVMHRDAKLGDCGVMFARGGQFHYVPEKELSYYRTALRILAKDRYPVALAEGFIDKDLVVKEVRDPRTGRTMFLSEQEIVERAAENLEIRRIVKPNDWFLTMDGVTAQSLEFARELVDNFDGLKAVYGLEDKDVAMVNPNWVDTLVWVLNAKFVSMLLIVGGVLGLYLELKLPGVAFPGIFAALCFLLFFWSHVMGGTATALEIVLFLAGVLCLGLEIFVIPGFGVFGVTGIVLIIVSIILASQTFILPGTSGEWHELAMNLGSLVLAFVSVIVIAAFVGKYLPHVPLLHRMVLTPSVALGGAGAAVAALPASPLEDLLGAEGAAMTTLRPAGVVRFGDRFVDVVAEGAYIDAGARVRVIEVTGRRVVVKQA